MLRRWRRPSRLEHKVDGRSPIDVPEQANLPDGLQLSENIFVEHNIGSKYFTLNRRAAHNALNLTMIQDLHNEYLNCDSDESVGLIVLRGAGHKAFCAGGDVAALAKMGPTPLGREAPQMAFFRAEYALNHYIGTLRNKVQASVLRGIVMGGGAGLSMHGAIRISTNETTFAMPETALGLFPDVGASHFLPRLTQKRPGLAMYLALTGRRLNGVEMASCGLASHYCDIGMIPGMLDRILTIYEWNLEMVNNILLEYQSCPPADQDELGRQQEAIQRCFAGKASLDDVRQALVAEAGGGGAFAGWARDTLAQLEVSSPTSLAVTFELLRRAIAAKALTLAQSLQMDARLVRRFMVGGDFFEGVRAALIDKDRTPAWLPAPTPAQVEEFFTPLPPSELELTLPGA